MSSADIHLMGQSMRGREPFFVSLFVCREMCVLPVNRAGRYDQKFISRYFSKLYRFHGI